MHRRNLADVARTCRTCIENVAATADATVRGSPDLAVRHYSYADTHKQVCYKSDE